MTLTYEATRAALDHYDRVDAPALDAMRRDKSCADLTAFTHARRKAADRVRAAFLKDIGERDTEENVALMSVERIRARLEKTLLGKMLGLLP